MPKKPFPAGREQAELLAIQALGFIASDPERLGRFLSITGIGPAAIRAAASEPRFLSGVLEHLAGDERLLLAFAQEHGLDPAVLEPARRALAGQTSEDGGA
ncbi:MAG: DUF3572 domain-containing protein [Pseudorhodoplanes sp.]